MRPARVAIVAGLGLSLALPLPAAGPAADSGPADAARPSAAMLEFLAEWGDVDAATFEAMTHYGTRDAAAGDEADEGDRDDD